MLIGDMSALQTLAESQNIFDFGYVKVEKTYVGFWSCQIVRVGNFTADQLGALLGANV